MVDTVNQGKGSPVVIWGEFKFDEFRLIYTCCRSNGVDFFCPSEEEREFVLMKLDLLSGGERRGF